MPLIPARTFFASALLSTFGGLGCGLSCGTPAPFTTEGEDAGEELAEGGCTTVEETLRVLATAAEEDEYLLEVTATTGSPTTWSEGGREALVLELSRSTGVVGHLVLHQGQETFRYGMHLGKLAAGEELSARVSPLSSQRPVKRACLEDVALTRVSSLGEAAEGVLHAPVFAWPVAKSFDDLPLVVGWSKARQTYEAVFSSENGGTVELCGGGSTGMAAEIARWGRPFDIERVFSYGGTPSWKRCTDATAVSGSALRFEGEHPRFYYGDGHNGLYESRGGYGQECGTSGDDKADGDLEGWNVASPGPALEEDGPFVILLRPLPVPVDALGYARDSGRREALADQYAPWLYRLSWNELFREGRIDGDQVLGLHRYLWVDVRVADVDGTGDPICSRVSTGGFVLRAETSDGKVHSSKQTTGLVVGSQPNVKRLAIKLDAAYSAEEVSKLVFDAYSGDGIFLLGLGEMFMAREVGDNGAALVKVHAGTQDVNVYVDDDDSGCTAGVNEDGPGGHAYPCEGGSFGISL